MSALRLHFFGKPQLLRDDQPIDLGAAKSVALLAYLAANPQPQSRDTLTALLWPDSPADAARKTLRNRLWAIRKQLGDDALSLNDDTLALAPTVSVDVREFESAPARDESAKIKNLKSQIDLYRGPFLDGFALADAPEFEIWLTTARERFSQRLARMLTTLIGAHQVAAQWDEVVAVAQRALAHDPTQEPMHRALMEAHARLGARHDALHQFEVLRATLERELGVTPLPETLALRDAIAQGRLQPRAPAPRMAQTRTAERAERAERVPFVGRESERAALTAELHAAAQGRTRVALLLGELGLGKSRLWHEWSASLDPRITILASRCLAETQALPFMPLIELLRSPICAPLFAPDSPLSPIWLAEVARLLPTVRDQRADLPPSPPAASPTEERGRLFEAFTQCLLALKASPLIIHIDDLHWADHATLEWLGYLTRRLRDEALLIVGAYRPTETPTGLATVVAGWMRDDCVRALSLQPLNQDEAAALSLALTGDPRAAQRAQHESAGNPYFLIELCRTAVGAQPTALSELVRARIAQLPAVAQQLLQSAAVLQPACDFATLRRVSGRDEAEALDALDALLRAAMLVERGERYAFAHPLIAALVHDGLSHARRASLHRRAAESLASAPQGSLAPLAGRLAHHYRQAGEATLAAHHAEQAGAYALQVAAATEAVAFYRQACELDATPARQWGLGRALYRMGETSEARALLEAALRGFEAQGARPLAARVCLDLGDIGLHAAHHDETLGWARKVLSYIDEQSDPECYAMAHVLLGGVQRMRFYQSLLTAEAHLLEAARVAAATNLPRLAARCQFALGNVHAQRGDLATAVRHFSEAVRLAQVGRDHYREIVGHNNLAYHALLLADVPLAKQHISEALALEEKYQVVMTRQWLFNTRGEVALAEGQVDEAESWFQRGLAHAERHENFEMIANYQAHLGLVARARGALAEAVRWLGEARVMGQRSESVDMQAQIELWLTEVQRARGDDDAAAETLQRAEALLADGVRVRLKAWAERLGAVNRER